MKRRNFISSSFHLGVGIGISTITLNCSTSRIKRKLPKVLILGDSISIGYTPFVIDGLDGIAEVTRPYLPDGKPENCAGTTKGVANIERWLGDTNWDVIHFNFGLHDLKHVKAGKGINSNDPNDPLQAPLDKYEENLRFIIAKLKETNSKLIFATTTPYPDSGLKPLRDPGLYKSYNKTALKLMSENNISINDLESFVAPQIDMIQKPKDVHFTEEGSKVMAEIVVKHIRANFVEN